MGSPVPRQGREGKMPGHAGGGSQNGTIVLKSGMREGFDTAPGYWREEAAARAEWGEKGRDAACVGHGSVAPPIGLPSRALDALFPSQ